MDHADENEHPRKIVCYRIINVQGEEENLAEC